jgi:hypothetical protein
VPYKIVHSPVKGAKDWKIVNTDTGKVVGRSTSKSKAEASVRARHAGEKK